MPIITISRQIASYGDEIAQELSKQFGYTFFDRKMLEADLLAHGITEENLHKYDERKPGFIASLARERDEYFDYLREAVYERAKDGNCVFIGRGGFAILKDIPSCYSVRLVAPEEVRVKRLMNEFNSTEKAARALMQESDTNRRGYHKCFFNIENDDSVQYRMVLNTENITPAQGAKIIQEGCAISITQETAAQGISMIRKLLEAQKIVNHISFDLKIPVHFLEAVPSDESIVLHGVADSATVIDNALSVARSLAPDRKIESAISIVHDYKTYP